MNKTDSNKTTIEIDDDLVRELKLYAENDSDIYRQKHIPFVKNYRKKMDKGIYNQELAVKGILNNYVPLVIKKYKDEISPTLERLTKAEKDALAQDLLGNILNDINEGVE